MDQRLLDKVLDCPRLPSLPAIAVRVVELCRDKAVSVRDVGQLLSHDPALSAKILRTINSSYYGLRQPVTTVPHAVAMLGLESVKMLALGFSLVPTLKDCGGKVYDPTPLWRRSLGAAVGAQAIARRVGLAGADEAFLAGLLQDLGVMAMIATLRERYASLLIAVGPAHHRLLALERKRLDLDHTVVGERLAQRWNLPEALTAAIRWHETPDASPMPQRAFLRAVALAGCAVDCLGQRHSVAAGRFADAGREWFGLDIAGCRQLMETIHAGSRQLAKEFEIRTGTKGTEADILTEASELLVSLSIEAHKNAEKLEQENRLLKEQTAQDSLTGLHNRRAFDEQIELAVAAVGRGGSLGLIMLDIDHFKPINDQYGHVAGDQVLREVGARITHVLPRHAFAARYGGEEFVILVHGATAKALLGIAEAVRMAIWDKPVPCDNGLELVVSVSLGVGLMNSSHRHRDAGSLVEAADRAMYAAKHAGRNRVCVAHDNAAAA